MNLRTIGAAIAFFSLSISLMMEDPSMNGRTPATASEPISYDYALTAQKLVFSEQALPTITHENGYLLSHDQIQKMNQHSAEVVIMALNAIPAPSDDTVRLSQIDAESKTIKQ